MKPTEEDYALIRDRVMQDAAADREREAAYRLDRLAIDLAAAEGITTAGAYDRVLERPEGMRALADLRETQGRDGESAILRKAAEVLEERADISKPARRVDPAPQTRAVDQESSGTVELENADEFAAAEQIDWRIQRLAEAEGISKAEASDRLLSSPPGMRLRADLERARGNDAEAARWVQAAEDVEKYEQVRKAATS